MLNQLFALQANRFARMRTRSCSCGVIPERQADGTDVVFFIICWQEESGLLQAFGRQQDHLLIIQQRHEPAGS